MWQTAAEVRTVNEDILVNSFGCVPVDNILVVSSACSRSLLLFHLPSSSSSDSLSRSFAEDSSRFYGCEERHCLDLWAQCSRDYAAAVSAVRSHILCSIHAVVSLPPVWSSHVDDSRSASIDLIPKFWFSPHRSVLCVFSYSWAWLVSFSFGRSKDVDGFLVLDWQDLTSMRNCSLRRCGRPFFLANWRPANVGTCINFILYYLLCFCTVRIMLMDSGLVKQGVRNDRREEGRGGKVWEDYIMRD